MNVSEIERREHYLNVNYGIRSWLFTTDHKRIAWLYLLSVTVFFFIGGLFATLMRVELLTPQGDLVQAETYNKLFTMHGVTMVFFFLIPSIPAVLGNFLVPMMIGARDLAFPRLNLASWYIFIIGGAFTLMAAAAGGVDTGWTFYTPYSSIYSNTHVVLTVVGVTFSRRTVPELMTVRVSVSDCPTEAVVTAPSEAVTPIVAERGGRCPSRHVPRSQNCEDGQFWSVSHGAPSSGGKHPAIRASDAGSNSAARGRNGGRGRSIFSALPSGSIQRFDAAMKRCSDVVHTSLEDCLRDRASRHFPRVAAFRS